MGGIKAGISYSVILLIHPITYKGKPQASQKDRPTNYAQDGILGSAWAERWQEKQKDCWWILSSSLRNL